MRDEPDHRSDLIGLRLQRIEELKEALRHVSSVTDELALLKALSNEIAALRELRESRSAAAMH
jgi:hypothetical protein